MEIEIRARNIIWAVNIDDADGFEITIAPQECYGDFTDMLKAEVVKEIHDQITEKYMEVIKLLEQRDV